MPDTKFDAKAFLEFCLGKPAGEIYDGVNSRTCALAQFGHRWARRNDVGDAVYRAAVFHGPDRDLPKGWYTFGALADRLEAALSETVSS